MKKLFLKGVRALVSVLTLTQTAEAFVFNNEKDLEEARQHTAPDGVYLIGNDAAVGTGVIFETPTGQRYGITCAHVLGKCLRQFFIQKKPNSRAFGKNAAVEGIVHPSYDKEHLTVNPSLYTKNDIVLFGFEKKESSAFNTFKAGIVTEHPQPNKDYPVTIASFGPSLSSALKDYDEGCTFHQVSRTLTFNKEGYFCNEWQTREYFIKYHPSKPENCYFFTSGAALQGDSGALVLYEGQALALVSTSHITRPSYINQFFTQPNKKTNASIENFLKDCSAYSAHTKIERLSDGSMIYCFQLKEDIDPIRGEERYTPLSLHLEFINEFIKNQEEILDQNNAPSPQGS